MMRYLWLSERAHRLLLNAGPMSMTEIAEVLDCQPYRLEGTLYNLRRKGRVTHSHGLWAAVGEPYRRYQEASCQRS